MYYSIVVFQNDVIRLKAVIVCAGSADEQVPFLSFQRS